MDLKGAQIRNILNLCNDMESGETGRSKPLFMNIPYYQRPYKWDEERVKNLIEDFRKNKEERSDNMEYFVGSVVLVNDSSKPDVPMDIVDGQQRITTVFLLNFIRFLLLRAQVEKLLFRQRPGEIDKKYGELIDCYTKLVGRGVRSQGLEQNRKELVKGIDDAQDLKDSAKNGMWEDLLKSYRKAVGLPTAEAVQSDQYSQCYKDSLYNFLKDETLAIQYSRKSYNEKLKESLSCVQIEAFGEKNPKLEIDEDPLKKDAEDQNRYLGAIRASFDVINSEVIDGDKTSVEIAEAFTQTIGNIVENLQFCVVITGNEKDAYTLFEVLNDRAMEVDDLDLIKNLFFKTYCQNTSDDEDDIDRVIGEQDNRWGEDIFTPEIGINRRRRISYFGTVYLTGDTTLNNDSKDKYRENIERDYLSKQIDKGKGYGKEQLKKDIDVFEMASIILNKFGITERHRDESAIKAANDINASIACKAMKLFQALKQDGVAAALVNIIIRTFRESHVEQNNKMDDFAEYVEKLALAENQGKEEDGYKRINSWAEQLWKASIMAKDYVIPREIAKSIIKNVSAFDSNISSISISKDQADELNKQFKEWTSKFQYGTKDNLKAKILFIELLGSMPTNGKLQKKRAQTVFSSDKLELDHLEANHVDSAFESVYFKPNDESKTREEVVAGLGNMMLIDFKTNREMGNKPIEKRLNEDYKNQLDGHWLIDEAKNKLKENSVTKKIGDEEILVPTDAFFVERLKQLQSEMLELLDSLSA